MRVVRKSWLLFLSLSLSPSHPPHTVCLTLSAELLKTNFIYKHTRTGVTHLRKSSPCICAQEKAPMHTG